MSGQDRFVVFNNGTVVRPSGVHGVGLFATRPLRAGMPLCVEVALVVPKCESPISFPLDTQMDFNLIALSLASQREGKPDPVACLHPRLSRDQAFATYGPTVTQSSSRSPDVEEFETICLVKAVHDKVYKNMFEVTDGTIERPEQMYDMYKNIVNGDLDSAREILANESLGYYVLPFFSSAANCAITSEQLNAFYYVDARDNMKGPISDCPFDVAAPFILFATKDIKEGEEIFINYGSSCDTFERPLLITLTLDGLVNDVKHKLRAIDKVRELRHMFPNLRQAFKDACTVSHRGHALDMVHKIFTRDLIHKDRAVHITKEIIILCKDLLK